MIEDIDPADAAKQTIYDTAIIDSTPAKSRSRGLSGAHPFLRALRRPYGLHCRGILAIPPGPLPPAALAMGIVMINIVGILAGAMAAIPAAFFA